MSKVIGTKIKSSRIQKGWSQEYIAEQLNISQSAYAKIEKGISRLDVYRLIEIAKLLELEPAELFLEEGKIINFNHGHSSGFINTNHYADLKEAHEKHIESLKKEIERLNEEVIFLRTQLTKG